MRVFLASLMLTALVAATPLTSVDELTFNSDNRLESPYLVFTENCETAVRELWTKGEHSLRTLAAISGPLADAIFGDNRENRCYAATLDVGVPKHLVTSPLPQNIYQPAQGNMAEWIFRSQKVDIGFMQYHDSNVPVNVYWTKDGEKKHLVGSIGYGEKRIQWHTSHYGHVFIAEDGQTKEQIGTCTVRFPGLCVFGQVPPFEPIPGDYDPKVNHTLAHEWDRHNRVKRTFTEIGFQKSKLPDDLYASLSSYYYNNHISGLVREEWSRNVFHVNWWEADVNFIPIPFALKQYWQDRLLSLVEIWIGGVPLERTDIYGMRRYNSGARLVSHVDREATHAASLIINIDQNGQDEEWPLEIYDHGDRLHEIYMQPGDIVYYESARALHGRQQPLKGGYFVNLFAHYRPIGDPEWFLKSNPEGTPAPLLDIGDCKADASGKKVECTGGEEGRPDVLALARSTLSPKLEMVSGPTSLWDWWVRTTPAKATAAHDASEL